MKVKHLIGGTLAALGVLFILGAVGHLDYLDECGERYGSKEVREMAVRSVVGLAAAGMGAFLCRDVEFDEDKPIDKKENRAD